MFAMLRAVVGTLVGLYCVGVASAGVRTTLDCGPIRMDFLAQTDIQLAPPVREEPKVSKPAPVDLRVTLPTTQALRLSPTDDPDIATELSRLRTTANSSAATQRNARPAIRAASAQAAWTLGLIHLHGAGVPLDASMALSWFEQAQRLGHPRASAGLAWCEIDGCGTPGNTLSARRWLAELRKTSPAKAAYLEWLLNNKAAPMRDAGPNDDGTSLGTAPGQRELLLRAARAGEVLARNELGLEAAFSMRLEEALPLFESAASDSPAARANVKTLKGLLGDANANAAPSNRAAELLANAKGFHRGEGVPASYNEAIRLYRQAESMGNVEAGRMLALIFSRPGAGGGLDVAWMQQLAWTDLSGSVPKSGSPATGSILQRDPTALMDWLPRVWQDRLLRVSPR